ncbi:hypothetical protein LEP1GSC050_3351 [Leptospira broomii serovar Hurstbridge str. 5399]|uniref:Uncharacterized protein n=1 Tax=Leptospira broomii serovar Hurstbridge str. 5399 TaxID=1049789 RepID=T0FCS8_9LEPT|nr:hypothetical protein LEP1GSC050_3351 [Leptospira broomii serovar Hurstbridge str. 5399]
MDAWADGNECFMSGFPSTLPTTVIKGLFREIAFFKNKTNRSFA